MRRGQPMPAQLTARFKPPMSLCAFAMAAVDGGFVGDVDGLKARGSAERLRGGLAGGSFTSISVTCAPAATSRCATALPSPDAPPVMTARI